MKNKTTRALLIDPINKSITEIAVPHQNEMGFLRETIGCQAFCHVPFSHNIAMVADDFGLIDVPRASAPPHNVSQGYFVIHKDGIARELIAGKGIVSAFDANGEAVDLPARIDRSVIAQYIKFIPDAERNTAAAIGREILADAGLVLSRVDWDARSARHAVCVQRALALCGKN